MSVVPVHYQGWTISLDHLRDLCGPQVKAVETHHFFQEFTHWGEVCAEGFGDDATRIVADAEQHAMAAAASDMNNDTQLEEEEFVRLLAKLFTAFRDVTGGLTLAMEYFCEDEGAGDYVDHSDGCVFVVEGVTTTTYTVAGDRFKDLLNDQKWIRFC